ncbi:exopolysaccharide biosynthesis polyprenyl glycosylphosphotransferase [Patescibacteria group bacterium]|nr:exopolysaccharide biosynthesis polyprenyl glycosylphosphotransferase [Patescibacteria group bacterium]
MTLALRYKDFSFWPGTQTKIFVFHFSIFYFFWLLFLFILDFYKISFLKRIYSFFRNLIIFIFFAGATGTIYFYLQPQLAITPKTILFLDVLFFSCLFLIWRFVFIWILKLLSFKEKIVIIEFNPKFSELLTNSLREGDHEVSLIYNTVSSKESAIISNLAKYGVTSDISQLKKIIEKERVETVVFTPSFYKNEKLVKEIFSNIPLKLNFINFADFYENLSKKVLIETADELWFLENVSQVERKIDEILKRSLDIVFSFLGILITIVFLPFIALAIKLDSPGPIFFLQKRVGKDRKIFTLYKFRTMKVSLNQDKELWRERDPNQIIRVGKILRKFYLDELPQFLNILKGDISFVGPRPEWIRLAKIFEREIPFYSLRYIIRPGFTGWAQLNFPPSTSVEEAKEKFQYDLYYIKNRSFFLDLEIILKTIKLIFK